MRTVRIPLAIRIPAVVIVFMAAVAVFISERVLTRLQEAQTRHLGDLATVYLDGLAPALVAPVVREDVWEVFDIIDRARQIGRQLGKAGHGHSLVIGERAYTGCHASASEGIGWGAKPLCQPAAART